MIEHVKPPSVSWIYRGRSAPSGAHVYDHLDGTRILSAVEHVAGSGLEFHVSMSRAGQRLSARDARHVLLWLSAPWPVEQWLEDNHQGGIARNFWCHTEASKRRPCPCEANEKPIVEGDYVWREQERES